MKHGSIPFQDTAHLSELHAIDIIVCCCCCGYWRWRRLLMSLLVAVISQTHQTHTAVTFTRPSLHETRQPFFVADTHLGCLASPPCLPANDWQPRLQNVGVNKTWDFNAFPVLFTTADSDDNVQTFFLDSVLITIVVIFSQPYNRNASSYAAVLFLLDF